jgi:hypothetical protein
MYKSPNIIRQIKSRKMRWAAVWHTWEGREKCTGFWWESPKEVPFGRPRRRWEDGIKTDREEIGWGVGGGGGVEWIHLAQDRDRWRAVVNTVIDLRVVAPRS